MPTYFLDSSALVKAYRREVGTERVVGLLEGRDRLVIARLAQVEVSAAITRRGHSAGVLLRTITDAVAQMDRDVTELFDVVELTPSIMANAVTLTRSYALRGADAIQLACGVHAHQLSSEPRPLTFVGSDRELNAAAASEGFDILDPTTPA